MAILRFRRHREKVLPQDVFGEAAQDVPRELFAANAHGVGFIGRMFAEWHMVPSRTFRRWRPRRRCQTTPYRYKKSKMVLYKDGFQRSRHIQSRING
jgi:hypothetical protein